MKITINNTEVTLKFGYGFLRLLGQMWGCAGPAAVIKKFLEGAGVLISQIDGLDEKQIQSGDFEGRDIEIPFEAVDVFVDIIKAAAKADGNDFDDDDAVADFLFKNVQVMSEVLVLFMDSMPKVKPEDVPGKQKAAKKKTPQKKN